MDSFWKSALEAAEKAKSVAKAVSQKGMEFAEATAEEASKKFKDLGLHETAHAAAAPKQKLPTEQELVSYGITQSFIEFIRSLNYNAFREYPLEHDTKESTQEDTRILDTPPSISSPSKTKESNTKEEEDTLSLNPWQVRHATLVVRAVNEVNELRYVLCPRYMTDQRFWDVYFSLAKRHLPDIAFLWAAGDELPPVAGVSDTEKEQFMSFEALGSQLRSLTTKISVAASNAAHHHSTSGGGVQLTSFLSMSNVVADESSSGDISAPNTSKLTSAAAANNNNNGMNDQGKSAADSTSLLGADPDLEAYLQDVEDSSTMEDHAHGSIENGEDTDGIAKGNKDSAAVNRDDDDGDLVKENSFDTEIDIDQYLNELDDGGDDIDDADVDAVLRELHVDVDGEEES